MRLLVITQKVDQHDDVLGFFHEWLRLLSARVERLEVICLAEGAHNLPENVSVYSLGKPADANAMAGAGARLRYAVRLYRYLWQLRGRYDAVFVHMNPEYVVLAGWLWRLAGKRVVLWYSHRNVDLKLRIAERFVNAIASSAASSFQLPTKKLTVLGHGIDTAFFAPAHAHRSGPWRLVSVGRITPIKRLVTAVDALALLRERGVDAELTLVGRATVDSDKAYEAQLHRRISSLSLTPYVHFAGATSYPNMPGAYHQADVSLNLAPTGGLDKAVLESMACALPVLVSNHGFAEYLGLYRERLLFGQDNAGDLAAKLEALYHAKDKKAVGEYLRGQVEARAGLARLVDALVALVRSPR